MVFGVSEGAGDARRIVGIPRSTENQKHLADKLQKAEPALRFEVQNPQTPIDDERVLLVAEILRKRQAGRDRNLRPSHGIAH